MAGAQQELSAVVERLNDVENLRDLRVVRSCIYEILTLSTNGCDVVSALPTIVKLLAHSDAFVKRVAGELIAIYASQHPEMILLATNTLVQDCKDINPVVRGHALHVLGSLPSQTTTEMLNVAATLGLEDTNPYVRRFAALVSINLYQISSSSVTEGGLWDLLYTHLSDSDSLTVASCLCALEEIFAKEKGIVISNKLGQYLVSKITSFTPTVRRYVLQFLLKHSPKTKVQVFDHLNDLDESLSKSRSLATTLCSLELFCHLASELPRVRSKAYTNAWTAIKANLASERNEEMVTAVIDYMRTTNFPINFLVQDYNKFFCRDDDSVFLVKQKIYMLSKLITVDNAENILEELVRSARHLGTDAFREMIQSVTEVMCSQPEVEESCVLFLKRLIQLGSVSVNECVIQYLPAVTFSDSKHWSSLAPLIQESYKQIESVPGKIALLEIIRSHGGLIENAVEILEQIMFEMEDMELDQEEKMKHKEANNSLHQQRYQYSNNQRLKLSLVGAMVRLCLEYPAKVQPLLAKLMEQCIRDQNRHVRDRALFLYGYLLGKTKQDCGNIR